MTARGPFDKDQRAHPRVPLILSASLHMGGARFAAVVTDISAGGAGLHYSVESPAQGFIAQLDIAGFGVFDGITVRDAGDVRGIRFLQGESERHRLPEKLIRYIESGFGATVPEGGQSSQLSLSLLTGAKQSCQVEHISLHGVTLRTAERPAVGELVRLGRMYGRVSQHLPTGIGIRFLSLVSATAEPPKVWAAS